MNSNKTIPSKEESIKIFQRYILFSNVERHCVAVASVAAYLAEKIQKTKIPGLNSDIIFAVSLFHDLGKGLVIEKLEPVKFNFKPLDGQQVKTWQLLRSFYEPFKNLFQDLETLRPGLNKKVHETEIAIIIVGSLFPDFVVYMHQIGGTNNQIYFSAGPEIKIAHYADWIVHQHNLVSFDKRLEFLFNKYWADQSEEQRQLRKQKELVLEKELFDGLEIAPQELDLEEINKKKSELFKGEYDHFEIGRVDKID